MTKAEIQQQAGEAAIPKLLADKAAALLMGTGTTKTLTSIKIVDKLPVLPVLWLTSSKLLRDVDTPEEFVKWNYIELLGRTEFHCIQTAFKWRGKHFPIVVVDEADALLTPKYFDFFRYNTWDYILLVSATMADTKKEFLNRLAPVVFEYSTQRAQKEGVLNQSRLVFVNYVLSKVKNVPVKYKDKVTGQPKIFYTSENDNYAFIQGNYVSKAIELNKVEREINKMSHDINHDAALMSKLYDQVDKLKAQRKFWGTKRNTFLLSTASGRNIAQQLILKIKAQDESSKVLVFSSRTDQIDRICKYTYHTKNAGTKTNPNLNIDMLNKGQIRTLGVCSAIDRGKNLVGVDNAILESYDSSKTKLQQRHGREMRLDIEDIAHLYILCPYYEALVPELNDEEKVVLTMKTLPTRALDWADSMTEDFDLEDSLTINMQVAL